MRSEMKVVLGECEGERKVRARRFVVDENRLVKGKEGRIGQVPLVSLPQKATACVYTKSKDVLSLSLYYILSRYIGSNTTLSLFLFLTLSRVFRVNSGTSLSSLHRD